MSKLPTMKYEDRIKKTQQVRFGGLRHSLACGDGELYDMKNMTCKEYPIMQPREKRGIVDQGFSNPSTYPINYMIYADNGDLWTIRGIRSGAQMAIKEYQLRSSAWETYFRLGETAKDWKFTRFGDNVVLLPEKLLIKTGLELAGSATTVSNLPTLEASAEGTLYVVKATSYAAVYRWNGTSWDYYCDLITEMEASATLSGVKLTDGTLFGEKATANTMEFTGGSLFMDRFKEGDAVEIPELAEAPGNKKTAIIREIGTNKIVFSDNCFKMPLGEDGNPVTSVTISGTVKIKRSVPDMDACFEHDNRLWGYKGKTIYASKLGDPTNWNVFEGLSTDAWSLETQKKGEFTGCVSYGGYPTFFREGAMARIYGTTPETFQISEANMPGVKPGEHESIAEAGGMLLYLSRDGMMIYADEYPQSQTDVFGTGNIKNVIACSDGVRYYARMTVDEETALYRFDSKHGLWMKEDDPEIICMTYDEGTIYALINQSVPTTQNGGKAIITLTGDGNGRIIYQEETVQSFAEFGDFTSDSLNRKAMSKLQLRMELEEGASAKIEIKYDGGTWKTLWTLSAGKKRSIQVPVLPTRCDYYRIRISGSGMWRLYAMAREQYEGSEIH